MSASSEDDFEVELVPSKKGRDKAVYHGHMYVFASENAVGQTRWRCDHKNTCSAALQTFGTEFIRVTGGL